MISRSTPLLAAGILISVTSQAATILSQNFDTDPVNYVASPFINQGTGQDATSRYWDLSKNIPSAILNPSILGNTTTYLTGQNMDAPLPFAEFTPALLDFTVNVGAATDLKLSIDLAGLPTAEVANYVRAFTDTDGDGTYETPVFNFQGGSAGDNTAYVDAATGKALTATFQTFADFLLDRPTAADRNLRLRVEMYNDTDSRNEAIGIDNIVISGVPEPTTGLLLAAGTLGLARRRRAS